VLYTPSYTLQNRTRKIRVQNNKKINYTKHKQIDILSRSTQTSHVTEWRLKKSAPTFSDTLIALRVNWYCWRTKAQRMRRPFCPYWAFPKYNKGWRSVSKRNSFP